MARKDPGSGSWSHWPNFSRDGHTVRRLAACDVIAASKAVFWRHHSLFAITSVFLPILRGPLESVTTYGTLPAFRTGHRHTVTGFSGTCHTDARQAHVSIRLVKSSRFCCRLLLPSCAFENDHYPPCNSRVHGRSANLRLYGRRGVQRKPAKFSKSARRVTCVGVFSPFDNRLMSLVSLFLKYFCSCHVIYFSHDVEPIHDG